MPASLNVLIVEDSQNDAELLVRELRNAGFEPNWKRVETEADYRAGLVMRPDIIFSDLSQPQFSTLPALELLKNDGLDIPFIIVSGTIGEERAVESVKGGATDYVLKDHIKRIGPVVQRALKETRERAERKLAETALRVSEERFALALQGANDGLWDWNLDTDEAYFSPRWKSMLGYADNELENRLDTWKRLVHPEDRRTTLALVADFIEGRAEKFEVEFRMRHKAGYDVHILSRALFYDAGGKVRRLVGTHVDLTERKRAEGVLQESERRFREMLENVTLIAMTLDKNGMVTFCNDYLLQLTGWKREEIIGTDWFETFIPEANLEVKKVFLETVEAGDIPLHYGNPIATRSGELREILWSNTMLRDAAGNIIGIASIGEDVTERMRGEFELEQTHNQLLAVSRQAGMAEFATGVLHNVGNVLNSVNIATTCLSDSLRKSRSASLSKLVALMRQHETDLGAFFTHDPKGKQVPGYLAQLADELAREQATALKELGELQKNIEHIRDIITGQQDSAKMSHSLEALKLADLVEDTLKINASGLRRNGILVIKEFEQIPPIMAEKHKVLQILVNLVRNAMQACEAPAGQQKRLTLRVSQEAGRVRIAVTDNGTGILPENLSRIFAHGFTTKKDGHGFGLHSAALAAKEMGGSLTVQSDGPGHGATFTLELPMLS